MSELSTYFARSSRSLLHDIVKELLQYHKLRARWVPKLLTDDNKTKCMGASLNFLVRYHSDGDEFLNQVVTGDETWIPLVTPENKHQSMKWRHSASPKVKKFKQTLSTRKIMCTVFWDRHYVLLVDFMTQGTTINADGYCETVSKLLWDIQNKRRGLLLSSGDLLLHDNTWTHTAAQTVAVGSLQTRTL
jgi:hypothetical protein